ncbi:hypothetical protein D3C80_1502220 [compost metagenome]
MYNWLRAHFARRAPKGNPVPSKLTIDEIDSTIRGLTTIYDWRLQHGNLKGAGLILEEIDKLKEQRATLTKTPIPAITW